MLKTCTLCGEAKPLSEFHRNKRSKDGRRTWCAVCGTAVSRAHNAKHKDPCVYVVTHSLVVGGCKIGRATKVRARVGAIRTSLPVGEPALFWAAHTPTPGDAEIAAHSEFWSQRIRGEWFNVNPEEAVKFIKGYFATHSIQWREHCPSETTRKPLPSGLPLFDAATASERQST